MLRSLNISVDYYYKDHLTQLGMDPEMDLPAIFFNDNNLLLGAREINSYKTLEELIEGVRKKYNQSKKLSNVGFWLNRSWYVKRRCLKSLTDLSNTNQNKQCHLQKECN